MQPLWTTIFRVLQALSSTLTALGLLQPKVFRTLKAVVPSEATPNYYLITARNVRFFPPRISPSLKILPGVSENGNCMLCVCVCVWFTCGFINDRCHGDGDDVGWWRRWWARVQPVVWVRVCCELEGRREEETSHWDYLHLPSSKCSCSSNVGFHAGIFFTGGWKT